MEALIGPAANMLLAGAASERMDGRTDEARRDGRPTWTTSKHNGRPAGYFRSPARFVGCRATTTTTRQNLNQSIDRRRTHTHTQSAPGKLRAERRKRESWPTAAAGGFSRAPPAARRLATFNLRAWRIFNLLISGFESAPRIEMPPISVMRPARHVERDSLGRRRGAE